MNKPLVILRTGLLVFLFGVQTPQFAQDTAAGPAKPDLERHSIAVGLLRTINTAELGELSKYGAYSSRPILLAHQPKFFDGWVARFYSENPRAHFEDGPEILPGWSLRLDVHADGKGYDVRLQDLVDKTCWYAALSDESGVIRQSKVIDCNI
jgi:hypothetical protein